LQPNSVKIIVVIVAIAVIASGVAVYLADNNNDKGDKRLYEVTDLAGNKIKFDSVPERIITLNALTTEAMCELGLTSNIVGVTSDAGVHDVTNFIYGMDFDIEYPDQLKAQIKSGKTALVGPVVSWTTDQVMIHNPDVVIFQNSADNLNKMRLLQDMGVTCIVTNNTYDSVNVIYDNMELLGKAFGKSDRAQLFNNSMKEALEHIYTTCKGFEGKDVITCNSSSGGPIYAYSHGLLRHAILREMGCTTNMAGAATGIVTAENFLEYQPDVIIIGTFGSIESVVALKNKMESDPLWAEVKAMQNGEVYFTDYPCTQTSSYTSHHLVHGIALLATIVFDDIGINVPQLVEEKDYLNYISWVDQT